MNYAPEIRQPVNPLPYPNAIHETRDFWLPRDFTASSAGYLITELAKDISFSKRFQELAEESKVGSEFPRLVKEWRTDTMGVSSLSDMVMHPAYQRIMAMGEPALPFILKELRTHSGHWFYALEHIAGVDVAAGAENMSAAKTAWLLWGQAKGYIDGN